MISCSEGSTVSISTEFLTEDGQVLLPKVGWPRVVLQDENRDAGALYHRQHCEQGFGCQLAGAVYISLRADGYIS